MNSEIKQKKPISTPITDMVNNAKKDSTIGPLIASIIIIIIILIGGIYFWNTIISIKKNQIKMSEVIENQEGAEQLKETEDSSINTNIQKNNEDDSLTSSSTSEL